jgi:hypothetical protein
MLLGAAGMEGPGGADELHLGCARRISWNGLAKVQGPGESQRAIFLKLA